MKAIETAARAPYHRMSFVAGGECYLIPEVSQFLSFCLGRDEYAVPIQDVRAVLCEREADRRHDGVSYRGKAVEMCDIRRCLGHPETEQEDAEDRSVVIVVEECGRLFGLRADCVRGVFTVRSGELLTPPCVRNAHEADFAVASLLAGGQTVTVLKSEALARAAKIIA